MKDCFNYLEIEKVNIPVFLNFLQVIYLFYFIFYSFYFICVFIFVVQKLYLTPIVLCETQTKTVYSVF